MCKEIVYFSCINWGFLYQRPQHILTRLNQKGFRIIYIEPNFAVPQFHSIVSENKGVLTVQFGLNIFSRRQSNLIKNFNGIVVLRVPSSIISNINQISQILDSEYHLSQIYFPVDVLTKICNFKQPQIWTIQPHWLPLIKKIKHNFLVYDCLDEISGFKGHDDVKNFEHELIKVSNLIFCTASILLEKTLKYNKNCFLIPNAVDLEHFCLALNNNSLIPEDIKHIPGPIIGYIGCIADWFDFDLVFKAAQERPLWTFVLIGPILNKQLNYKKSLSNIIFLGKKDYLELPKYLRKFDVGIIPFKIIPLTEATDPVKLYEYFASGIPVVSTRLPEVVKFIPFVSVADCESEFINKIEHALNKSDAKSYLEIAKKNTWDQRITEILKILKK